MIIVQVEKRGILWLIFRLRIPLFLPRNLREFVFVLYILDLEFRCPKIHYQYNSFLGVLFENSCRILEIQEILDIS